MNKLLHAAAEYPVLIGITVFLAISLLLAVSLGVLMRRAGVSLKPLVFFFGFLAIIAVPQTVVHLLDAFVHARQIRVAPGQEAVTSPATAAPSTLQPVSWDIVFGPNADPSLITDAKPVPMIESGPHRYHFFYRIEAKLRAGWEKRNGRNGLRSKRPGFPRLRPASNRWRTWLSTWSAAPLRACPWRNTWPITGRRERFRRLLKYWSAPRCCRFLALAKAGAQRRYPQRSRPSEQRRPATKATQPFGREANKQRASSLSSRYSPLRGRASLAPCPPPVCLYARPTPIFQQSPRQGP